MTRNSDLVTAVEDSLRAPSVHNTQPWRWRFRGTGASCTPTAGGSSPPPTPRAAISC